jgi:hypothetical protein
MYRLDHNIQLWKNYIKDEQNIYEASCFGFWLSSEYCPAFPSAAVSRSRGKKDHQPMLRFLAQVRVLPCPPISCSISVQRQEGSPANASLISSVLQEATAQYPALISFNSCS